MVCGVCRVLVFSLLFCALTLQLALHACSVHRAWVKQIVVLLGPRENGGAGIRSRL